MKNRTGLTAVSGSSPQANRLHRPKGRLIVDFADAFGANASPMDRLPAGMSVAATGTVTSVNVHGTDDAPRATLVLTSNTGDSATVAIDSEAYPQLFGELVEGHQVELRGEIKRPFKDMPPFLQAASVRTLATV